MFDFQNPDTVRILRKLLDEEKIDTCIILSEIQEEDDSSSEGRSDV